jgi:DNA-binding IclR family transcriptional regulator
MKAELAVAARSRAGSPRPGRDDCTVASVPKRFGRDDGTAGGLRSVGAALDVLECFAVDGSLGVSDVARRLGIAKSTAHRLLQTLCSRGFVEQDRDTGQYRLGIHLYELGHLAQARNTFRHAALPHLKEIAAATGHTVNFAVPDGADVVFVERIEVGEGGQVLGHVGRRLPLHCTSSGKVIAAFNPAVDQARRTAGFPPFARRTIRTESAWSRALADVRRQGFAVSHGESFEGMTSIAVPVMQRKVAVASISAFGPTEKFAPDLDRLRVLLATAARQIAARLP